MVEATYEEDGEPLTGRRLAVASTDMALVPLWQVHTQQGKIMALLYARSSASAWARWSYPSFQAGLLDWGPLRLGIQAILGVNAFAGRHLQIDFPPGRLYLLQEEKRMDMLLYPRCCHID